MTIFCAGINPVNRNRERNQLLSFVRNSLDTFVFGLHGIGKTTLTRAVAKEYESKFGQAVYIDCLLFQTANAILREILFSLGSIIASRSNYELTKRLKEKTKRLRLVIFLDHSENLKGYEILKILVGLNLCVCLVSDSFESYRKMDLFLKSRFANIMKIEKLPREKVLKIIKEKTTSVYRFPIADDLIQRIVERSARANLL